MSDLTNPEFGDFDPDDAYAEGVEADITQVAIRLHEGRQWLLGLSGEELPVWWLMRPEEREIGEALAQALVDKIATDPDEGPRTLADAVAFVSDQPTWNDLSSDAQEVFVGLVDDLLGVLQRQGALG